MYFKKPNASQALPDRMSNKEGKFGRLTGNGLATILAFMGISGSNYMVNHARLLCSAEIQVPFFLLAAIAAHWELDLRQFCLLRVLGSQWQLEMKTAIQSLNLNVCLKEEHTLFRDTFF